MTLIEKLGWLADKIPAFGDYGKDCANTMYRAADRIKALEAEVERLPARRAQPTVKTAPIAPTNWPAWGMIDETDEEFAERAGRKVTEVVR